MINNRNIRAKNAQETLKIIEQGYYTISDNNIQLKDCIEKSVKATTLYSPHSFESIDQKVEKLLDEKRYKTVISVKNCTSMQAADNLLRGEGRIGCLNFASAKNPGGGFLSGSQAQEESLTRASALYPTLMKYFTEMYEYNRSQDTYLYSDYMIYSPDVVFFKDDNDILLKDPYKMDILTSPAVNIGAMIQNKRSVELEKAKEVMMKRIDKILSVFVFQGVNKLILGAWGCGVFRNEPVDIANYFTHYLKNNGKYSNAFEKVIFAVFDKSKDMENVKAFENIFSDTKL